MKRFTVKAIASVTLAAVLAVTPFVESAANINVLSVTASAATTCRRITLTQSEYNTIKNHWNNKGVSYLGYDLYPSSAKKLAIIDMQNLLNKVMNAGLTVDGQYGSKSQSAVKQFQRAVGISADGLFGNASFNKLMSYIDIASTPASISFSNLTKPTTINQGSSFNLYGTISSSKPLNYVKGEILNSSNIAVCSRTVYTSAYTLNIYSSAINTYLKFGSLSAGNYTLKYTAVANDGTTKTYTSNFTVKSTAADIKFTSMTTPTTLNQGNSFNLYGTVSSSKPLNYVRGEIISSSGATVCSKTVYTSTYSHNLNTSAINSALKFGGLNAGSYTLKYTAAANDGTIKNYTANFTVNAKTGRYNFNAAYNYAKTYWNQRNYQYSYYTGNNCANFVSQCLSAAGIPQTSTWKNGTYAFINVNGLKNYFQNTYGIKYYSNPSASLISAGDVIYTSDHHVMFVMGKNSKGQVLASGNTNNRDCLVVTSFYGVLKTSTLF